ncbi:amidohydrolase family protein [Heliobacterium gestii]|uniref:Amidohydrolase family protein n=1 Tax=Heliomicrobium gestii TaxID=2699 RepID=A0A845LI67_HELGE|nr:amidohydrolase [Heliomicrobium gestii]MBM7866127.1 imidazolonepropionase-like amidohydrolase [Heliomicrobium gestii]MZP42546.1 amidohydrolase family protein [Heliomicrobium gestii]
MATVIRGAHVITLAGENYSPGFLAFTDAGAIVAVGPDPGHERLTAELPMELPVEEPIEVIDGAGRLVLPGFIDAHCHVGIAEEGAPIEGDDLNETSEPLTPHLQALDGINPLDPAFADALRGGVTTVCVLPGSANIMGGQAVIMKTAGPFAERVVCNSAAVKAALGENPKRVYGEQKKAPITRMASAALLREALARAREYGRRRAETAGEPSKAPEVDLRWEALQPLLARQVPLRLHAHRADDLLTGLRIIQEFGLQAVLEHCTEGHLIAGELAQAGVPAVVGPSLVNRAKVEMREITPATAGILHGAGVLVALMTDHPVIPIQYLPLCAGLAVRHGMEEETALRAISLHAARILGLDAFVGSLEPGKQADVVLWDGHPFDTRSSVTQVWIRGRMVYSPEASRCPGEGNTYKCG